MESKSFKKYCIVYNPATFSLMDKIGEIDYSPLALLSYLTNKNAKVLNASNYLKFLRFDLKKERTGLMELTGIENYSSYYIANQITMARKDIRVIIADGKRREMDQIIQEEGCKPEAVFMTTMSSNYPAAVAAAISLNHGGIPTIIGGIHVSTSTTDTDNFIRKYVPFPQLVSQVRGPGDSKTLKTILNDLNHKTLQPEYFGYQTIEDGVWGNKRVKELPDMVPVFLKKLPLIGDSVVKYAKINVTTPYLGCPYSCNFCAISTLPNKHRKFVSRDPEDFVNELLFSQHKGVNLKNRFFFFLPDNLLLGGKKLEKMLDLIIATDLKINYAAQISIDVAKNTKLLKKLRLSGATHFFIGFESLNMQNLEYIGKNITKDIKKSGMRAIDYYAKAVSKIKDQGISIHGAFIFGLPYDYFNSLEDHSGIEVADFCIKNNIGLQPTALNDLPGSRLFNESQANGTYLYGRQGSMDYLNALCIADLSEINRRVPVSLHGSPLVVAYMSYNTISKVGSNTNAIRSALVMAMKAFKSPTLNGLRNIKDRAIDSLGAIAFQLAAAAYKDLGENIVHSKNGIKGIFERLFETEQNDQIKCIFKDFIENFKEFEAVSYPTSCSSTPLN